MSGAPRSGAAIRGSVVSVLGVLGLGLLALACGGGDDDAAPGGGGGSKPGSSSSSSSGGSGTSGGSSGDSGTQPNGKVPTGDCVINQDITKSATWSPASCPDGYLLKFATEVKGLGVELRLEPGTVVKSGGSSVLTVEDGAALIAKGTPAAKIVFDGAVVGAGSWPGMRVTSNNPLNELSHVVIQHAGARDDLRAAISTSKEGVLSMSDVEIIDNERFGVGIFEDGRLTMNRVAFRRNAAGVAQVGVPYVKYLKGEGNSFEENGADNAVIVEATALYKITENTVWPNLSPAVYRIAGQNGSGGGIVKVEQHLTIEAGATFDMAGGSGFLMAGGTSGLRAVGTPDKKIVFRGLGGSSWSGITFGESPWEDNRLEYVEVKNASAAPSWGYYGTGNPSTPKAGILLGYNVSSPVKVALKNFTITGPNNAPADVAVKPAVTLQQEGAVIGTGSGGVLAIQAL